MIQTFTEQSVTGKPEYPNYFTQVRAIFPLLMYRAVAAALLIVRMLGAQSPSSLHLGGAASQTAVVKTMELAVSREVADKGRGPEAVAGSSGQPACAYRDGFHVPPQFRKEGEPFRWGVLGVSAPVRLRVKEKVSTSRAQAGDRIDLEVMEDVQVEGYPVIRKGAEAWGIITDSKRPGVGVWWIVYDDNPDLPTPLFGHKGDFPTLQFKGGRLKFRIEGAYDITGGQVPLFAADVISGEDNSPTDALSLVAVMSWDALRHPLQKVSGKPVHSMAGRHAALNSGTEIEALVHDAVCYDVGFLEPNPGSAGHGGPREEGGRGGNALLDSKCRRRCAIFARVGPVIRGVRC
jgi:hypothetical protein